MAGAESRSGSGRVAVVGRRRARLREQIAHGAAEAGQHVLAVQFVALAHAGAGAVEAVDAHGVVLRADDPDEADAGADVFLDPPVHFVVEVVRARHFDSEVWRQSYWRGRFAG